MIPNDTAPDIRHRKTLRAAALDLHRIATDMKLRRGHVPPDDPIGYVACFSAALRDRAHLLETLAKSETCAGAKRAALDLHCDASEGTPEHLAHGRATLALLTVVNLLAKRAGLDPYEGLSPIPSQETKA